MSSLDLLLGTSSAQEAPGVHQQTTQEGTDASASQDTLPNFANALDLILNDGVASDTVSKEDQNGGNGNNNSSSNGATSNSDDFFDFFETSQQSQQQQQQPQTQLVDIGEASEKCSLEMLKEVLDVLKVASHKHNRTLLEEGKL